MSELVHTGVDRMLTIAQLIQKEAVDIKGSETDKFCLEITANWDKILGGEGE